MYTYNLTLTSRIESSVMAPPIGSQTGGLCMRREGGGGRQLLSLPQESRMCLLFEALMR